MWPHRLSMGPLLNHSISQQVSKPCSVCGVFSHGHAPFTICYPCRLLQDEDYSFDELVFYINHASSEESELVCSTRRKQTVNHHRQLLEKLFELTTNPTFEQVAKLQSQMGENWTVPRIQKWFNNKRHNFRARRREGGKGGKGTEERVGGHVKKAYQQSTKPKQKSKQTKILELKLSPPTELVSESGFVEKQRSTIQKRKQTTLRSEKQILDNAFQFTCNLSNTHAHPKLSRKFIRQIQALGVRWTHKRIVQWFTNRRKQLSG